MCIADLKQIGDDHGFDAADGRVKRAQHADNRHGQDLRHVGDRVQCQRSRVQHQCGAQDRLHAERHGRHGSGGLAETLFQVLKPKSIGFRRSVWKKIV